MCYVYIYISWCKVHQYKILSYICYHLIHLWIESMKQTVWCFWMLLIVTSSITVCALVPVVMPWEETINLASASNCWNSAACLSWRQAGDKLKLDQLVQGVTTCYKMLQHVTTPKKHWVQRYMIIYQNIQDSWAQLQFKTIFEPSGRNLAQTFEDAGLVKVGARAHGIWLYLDSKKGCNLCASYFSLHTETREVRE